MIRVEPNAYSRRWFKFLHSDITQTRKTQEGDFVCAYAPLPSFRKVVDVCCGMGRHARALSSRGYSVIGVERDAPAIARANALGGGPTYIQVAVRDYGRSSWSSVSLARLSLITKGRASNTRSYRSLRAVKVLLAALRSTLTVLAPRQEVRIGSR